MRDRQYATMGVPAVWTPARYPPIPLIVLASLGDQVGQPTGFRDMVTEVPTIRARVSEVSAATDGVDPASGDPICVNGADYLISGAPQKRDARRLEWTIELARA